MPKLLLSAVLALAFLVGCGGDKTKTVTVTNSDGSKITREVPDVKFAKTKFVLHAGLAFGAFRRYIYKPYQAGGFKKTAPKRKRTIVKAALAGAFAVRELKLARRAALSDDKLRPVADAMAKPLDQLGNLTSLFQGGSFNPAAILGTSGALGALGKAASGAGATIKDRSAPLPG